MSNATIRPRVAIPAVAIVLAIIVWRLWFADSNADAIPTSRNVATRPRDPSWDSEHVAIPVSVDSTLGRDESREKRVSNVPLRQLNPYVDEHFLEVNHFDDGQLHLVAGTTDGYSGDKAEIHLRPTADGAVLAEVSADDFYDFGPPFSHFWHELQGHVKVNASTWKHGDVVLVDFELRGQLDGESRSSSGRLRVEVP